MKDSRIFWGVRDEHASIKLLEEICYDEPLTRFKNLEKYRDNLKILFNERGSCWTDDYIDKCVACARYIGNIKINQKTVDFITKHSGPNLWNRHLLDVLATLYIPHKMVNHIDYFKSCEYIINMFYGSQMQWQKEANIDSGNEELDILFNHLIEIVIEGLNNGISNIRPKIWHNGEFVSVIFAYLHYHNLDDYRLIDTFLTDPDYYCSKLLLNGKWIMKKNDINNFDYNNTKYLFNNMEKILAYDKKIAIK